MKQEDLLNEVESLRRRVAELEDLQETLEKTEEELREREEAFRSLFENSPDAILLTIPDGNVIKANPAACRMLGRNEQEICEIGRDGVMDLADPRLSQALDERARTGFFRGELNVKRKDGTIFPAEISSSFFRSRDGNLRTCIIFRDLSECKKTEGALKDSIELLAEAQRVARIGNWSYDLRRNKVTWSDELYRIFGIEKPEFGGKFESFIGLVHPKDQQLVLQINGCARTVGTPFDFEYRIVLPDGQVKTIREVGYADKDHVGNIIRLFGTAQDITDRKEAEERLRESEERLRLVTETIEDVFWMTTPDLLETTFVSSAYETIWGRTRESLYKSPQSFMESVHPEDRERLLREIKENRERQWTCEYRIVLPNGTIRWIHDRGYPILDESGNIRLRTGVATDITDRKAAEKEREALRNQLFQAQKMEALATLTGGIAHDFNNLLTIINGYTELILLEKTGDDPNYEDLQKILQTGRKGAELVQRLLTLSKKGESNPRPLDLNDMVENCVTLIKRTFPKMIEIETFLEKDLSTVNADAAQVDQVLMNLCTNAKDAMPEGGKLRIQTKNVIVDESALKFQVTARPGPHVVIEVTDTGPGINKEMLDRLFDPFSTTKGWDFKKGTGLSLPVTKGIVEQHGGWLSHESEPGKGTTFRIYFPTIAEATAIDMPVPEVRTFSDSERILLVDDEDYVRDLGKRILERAGYDVITASNGFEALEVYAREKSNVVLVILDLIMPQMGGEKCLEEMLKINPEVKVVISSGHSLDSNEQEHLIKYAKGFITKPYQIQHLLGVVKQFIGTK